MGSTPTLPTTIIMKKIRVLLDGWKDTTLYQLKKDNVCRSICIQEDGSSLYTVFRPAQKKGLDPVRYYRKYKCVPHNYTNVVNGRYYCNPAHCSRSWTSKEERDKHLNMAYGILG